MELSIKWYNNDFTQNGGIVKLTGPDRLAGKQTDGQSYILGIMHAPPIKFTKK